VQNRNAIRQSAGLLRPVRVAFVAAVVLFAFFPLKAAAQSGPCSTGISVQQFYVGTDGNVTNAGRTTEGPVCVEIHYNRLRFNLGLNFQTTYTKGVDPSSVLTTGAAPAAAQGAAESQGPKKVQLDNISTSLSALDTLATTEVPQGVKAISSLLTSLDASIAPGKAFPNTVLKSGYEQLKPALADSQKLLFPAFPSDVAAGSACPAAPSATPAAGSPLAILLADQMDPTFYPANKQEVDNTLTLANLYKCAGDGYKAFVANIAMLKFWDNRFGDLGLHTTLTNAQIEAMDFTAYFIDSAQLNCTNIFNQSSSTTASLTDYDESQAASGATPAAHQQQNFFTLTCGSPFAVSVGVEFSTIRAQAFEIAPSKSGGNVYALSSNSAIHPLPIAIVHVRLAESADHKFALHASAGVSGNLQGQNSGGSSAEFLLGPSVSFFRTMFITGGLHIGAKSSLAGGFSVGDAVPSGTTTPSLTKSYTVGFGFAITFAKP